jgi:hypothetical protein
VRSTSIPILRIKSPLPVRQHKDFSIHGFWPTETLQRHR